MLRGKCRCGQCILCLDYAAHPERYRTITTPTQAQAQVMLAGKQFADAIARPTKVKRSKFIKVTPVVAKTLPNRRAKCKNLGACAKPGHCGDQRRICLLNLHGGIVKHWAECQTCEAYIKKE